MTKFLIQCFAVVLLVFTLNGCVQTSQTWKESAGSSTVLPSPSLPDRQIQSHPVEVALLVPLSGRGRDLGQAILNAAQLAVFDMAPQDFQLIPRDTQGTPFGAQIATQEAINNGADLILGPLFSNSVKSASAAAAPHNINIIGFTTDSHAVSYNSFAMGFLPSTQVETILRYAMEQKHQRFSIVVQNNQYGALVSKNVRQVLSRQNVPSPHVHTIDGETPDLNRLYNEILSSHSQAILLAVDMTTAISISNYLLSKGLPNQVLQRLGLGLWDDAQRTYSSALEGAWYAAPSPLQRDRFTRLYENTYDVPPPRLASMGYDATALAISLAKRGIKYSKDDLIRPNGFYGLDGIFRFRPNGLVERGLAIMEFSRGRTIIRQDSPKSF